MLGLGKGKIEEYLNKFSILKLQEGDKQRLNLSISIQEVEWAIDNLKVGKTLGLDGLTAKFYKKFKDLLMPYLKVLFDY